MKPVIDRTFCIGCGRCVNVCPEVFRFFKAKISFFINEIKKSQNSKNVGLRFKDFSLNLG